MQCTALWYQEQCPFSLGNELGEYVNVAGLGERICRLRTGDYRRGSVVPVDSQRGRFIHLMVCDQSQLA